MSDQVKRMPHMTQARLKELKDMGVHTERFEELRQTLQAKSCARTALPRLRKELNAEKRKLLAQLNLVARDMDKEAGAALDENEEAADGLVSKLEVVLNQAKGHARNVRITKQHHKCAVELRDMAEDLEGDEAACSAEPTGSDGDSSTESSIDPEDAVPPAAGKSPAASTAPTVTSKSPPAPAPAPVTSKSPPAPVTGKSPPAPVTVKSPPAPAPAPVTSKSPPALAPALAPAPVTGKSPPAPVTGKSPPAPVAGKSPVAQAPLAASKSPPAQARHRPDPDLAAMGVEIQGQVKRSQENVEQVVADKKRRKTVTPDAMPSTDVHLVQPNQLISKVTRFIEATRERLQGPQDGLVLRDAYLDVTREIRELAYLHQVTTDSLRTSPPMIHQCMQEEICLSKLTQFSIELSSRIGSCVLAQPICA